MFKSVSVFCMMVLACAAAVSGVQAQGKKILIVDDSAAIRQQASNTLKQAGFTTVEASDGVEGKAKLQADSSIAVVLCDINMPKMTGLELLEWARADKKYAAIPFVMLTTQSEAALDAKARKAGAKGSIFKPFSADLLVSTVKKVSGN